MLLLAQTSESCLVLLELPVMVCPGLGSASVPRDAPRRRLKLLASHWLLCWDLLKPHATPGF